MGNVVGCFFVIELLKRGVIVGLGIDGYISDMFELLKVVNIIYKYYLKDLRVGFEEL